MVGPVSVAVAQFRPRKAAYAANLVHLAEVMAQAVSLSPRPDVLVLPETALTGYFLQGGVAEVARSTMAVFDDLKATYEAVAGAMARPLDIVIGYIEIEQGRLFNSCLYATLGANARLVSVHRKVFLPTYGVFDEKRYVNRGRRLETFESRAGRAGILICEDAWHSLTSTILALRGASIVYIPLASPARGFHESDIDNLARWVRQAQSIAEEHGIFVVTSSLVGFEGGKGFIGSSVVVDPLGHILAQGPVGDECLLHVQIDPQQIAVARSYLPLLGDLEAQLPDLIAALEEGNTLSCRQRGYTASIQEGADAHNDD